VDPYRNSEASPICDPTPPLARQHQTTSQRRPKISEPQPPKHNQPMRPEFALQLRQQVGFSHFIGGILSSRTGQTDRRSEPSSQFYPRTFREELNMLTKNRPPKRPVPENPKNSKVTPSTHLHLKFAETTPKRGWEGSVTVHHQLQPTDQCCHQFVDNSRCCVVPKTTKSEHQTPTTAETVEDTLYSHLTTGGTDRLTKRSESQPTSKNHRSGIPPKTSSQKNRAVRKTRSEPNRGPTKRRRNAIKSGPVQSTAENCPILPNCHTVPRHVVLLLHNTGKQQTETTRARQHRSPMTQIAPHR